MALFFGQESNGKVEVFYTEVQKAKEFSDYDKANYPMIVRVDVLNIARTWARNNLNSSFQVESIHFLQREKCGLKVQFYRVRIGYERNLAILKNKYSSQEIMVLPNSEVVTGEWINSKEFYGQFNTGKAPNRDREPL